MGRHRDAAYWLTIALKLIQQDGRPPTVADIAKLIGYRQATVRRIVRRFNELGPDGFLPEPPEPPQRTGRKPILTAKQIERLQRVVASEPPPSGDAWTAEAVRREIRRRFRVEVSRTTAWRYVKGARANGQASLFG